VDPGNVSAAAVVGLIGDPQPLPTGNERLHRHQVIPGLAVRDDPRRNPDSIAPITVMVMLVLRIELAVPSVLIPALLVDTRPTALAGILVARLAELSSTDSSG